MLELVHPGLARAQDCDIQSIEAHLAIKSFVTNGPECVTDVVRQSKLCTPNGTKPVKQSIEKIKGYNDMVTTSIDDDGDFCRVYTIRMRPYDHRGGFPSYVCSPAEHLALAKLDYCKQ